MGENTKMGRPRKYTREQARKAKNKQINYYIKTTYEKLQENVPIGTNQRLKDASAFEGMSKRAYLLSAIENRLEITEKISKKS